VTCGIYLSRWMPQVVSPRVRLRAFATWETVVFILNGVVFILIGLQLPTILRGLTGLPVTQLIWYAGAVSLVVIGARILWVMPALRFATRDFGPDWRSIAVVGWAGMRGIVSLAAAMALPNEFPHRELILFLTFGVILATLVVQGITLPVVIRSLRLELEPEGEEEEVAARYLGALAAIERLDKLAGECAASGQTPALARIRAEYDERVAYYSRRLSPAVEQPAGNGEPDGSLDTRTRALNLHREALSAERQMLIRLRDQGVVGDDVLRRVQEELDLEESRLGE
jgi:monovalent cation/hydrogen antiporter